MKTTTIYKIEANVNGEWVNASDIYGTDVQQGNAFEALESAKLEFTRISNHLTKFHKTSVNEIRLIETHTVSQEKVISSTFLGIDKDSLVKLLYHYPLLREPGAGKTCQIYCRTEEHIFVSVDGREKLRLNLHGAKLETNQIGLLDEEGTRRWFIVYLSQKLTLDAENKISSYK
jgi:hypothetical protein